ncbi:hypothetical protein [Microbulbifer sp. VAAF005]|uniref:hypothetical protein n=1 Tax=Microbulbifer sp. VAAF005 TaxID=3034230 RepID=UPI0024AD9F9A|nr:hypothetical protein [Microbulbifer sp. VAAF005]WHI45398.1 hypothetical protein P0078_16915 [Microbulbifer sp. VAAF005]
MAKVTMLKYIAIVLLVFSQLAISSEIEVADVHENYLSGSLPMPYGSFKVSVSLYEGNRDVSKVEINVGALTFSVRKERLVKLKSVNLSSVFVGHEIYRSESMPYEKLDASSSDLLIVNISSTEGFSRDDVWYTDYYTILINLESQQLDVSKFEYAKP